MTRARGRAWLLGAGLLTLLGLVLAAAPLLGSLRGEAGGWALLLAGVPVAGLGVLGLGGVRFVRLVGTAVGLVLGYILIVVATAPLRELTPPPGEPSPPVDVATLLTGAGSLAAAVLLAAGRPCSLPARGGGAGDVGPAIAVGGGDRGPEAIEAGRAPMTPRRAVVLLTVVLVLVGLILADLNTVVRIDRYRVVDQRTIVISVYVEPLGWTRVTGVTETPTEVRITVEDLAWPALGPQAATLTLRELTVSLSADLGDRVVRDGLGNVVPRTEAGTEREGRPAWPEGALLCRA